MHSLTLHMLLVVADNNDTIRELHGDYILYAVSYTMATLSVCSLFHCCICVLVCMCVELSLSASELHFRPHGEEAVGGTVQSTRYNVFVHCDYWTCM